MTRNEAREIAEDMIEDLLRSGDAEVFEKARGPDGRIDRTKLVAAALRTVERLTDSILNDPERDKVKKVADAIRSIRARMRQ
jgi:hypothetical protein